jgi:hypothetical protein
MRKIEYPNGVSMENARRMRAMALILTERVNTFGNFVQLVSPHVYTLSWEFLDDQSEAHILTTIFGGLPLRFKGFIKITFRPKYHRTDAREWIMIIAIDREMIRNLDSFCDYILTSDGTNCIRDPHVYMWIDNPDIRSLYEVCIRYERSIFSINYDDENMTADTFIIEKIDMLKLRELVTATT